MATIDMDPEDYIDEIDTDILIDELKSRKVLPNSFKHKGNEPELSNWGKYPKRELLTAYLEISPLSTLEDCIEKIKIFYYK